jgi:hypothetical protein
MNTPTTTKEDPSKAQPHTAQRDPLLTHTEILVELQVTREELQNWRTQGLTPKFLHTPNKTLRMRESTLRAWIIDGVPHPLPTVTAAQAAAELDVSTKTFTSWVRRGLIPDVPTDLPSDGRIPRSVLDTWMASLTES